MDDRPESDEFVPKKGEPPTPEAVEHAKRGARGRGWLTDDGWIWEPPDGREAGEELPRIEAYGSLSLPPAEGRDVPDLTPEDARDAIEALDRDLATRGAETIGCERVRDFLARLAASEPEGNEPPEERCGRCGGTRDKPRRMTDDAYSEFSCPHPFHDNLPAEEREAGEEETLDEVEDRLVKYSNDLLLQRLEGREAGEELVTVRICPLCMAGAGGECHTPGCALWMNRAPDAPVLPAEGRDVPDLTPEEAQRLYDYLDEWEPAHVADGPLLAKLRALAASEPEGNE